MTRCRECRIKDERDRFQPAAPGGKGCLGTACDALSGGQLGDDPCIARDKTLYRRCHPQPRLGGYFRTTAEQRSMT